MKILVLNGSPRVKGNTAGFVAAFKEGAESSGHEVTVFPVAKMKISGCCGCNTCHSEKNSGKCCHDDDMQEIYPYIDSADLIVFASPVYYWSFTGQMQSAISRFYSKGKPAVPKYAMILSSGSPNVYDALTRQFNDILGFFGAESAGIKTFCGPDQLTEANLAEMKAFGASL